MAKPKDIPKKRKKRAYTLNHSKDLIDLAVEAIKKKTMSSYEAERAFGIPRRTLLDKLHNNHPKTPGCPTRLTEEEEANVCKVLIAAADYGSPLTLLDLRIVVYRYLEANGKLAIFDNKLPGKKWVYSFLKRNKSKLTKREVQNIKRSRAEKTREEISEYFKNLKTSLEGVPEENIINYDETNLTDNPGAQKCLFKRGVKYPERVLNFTKGAISIMFAITAAGECLPPYVVYKAEHLYTQWTINGPKGCRFNRSKSGWFDSTLFEDWFKNIILPWAKTKTGTKLLIGDNLASHINHQIVKDCEANDIRFVFLPPNSSHLTQPLDVCYFGPLKKIWREILLNYKTKNPREATVNKGHFPELLKKLLENLDEKKHNILNAFKATGIAPLNPDKVVRKLPDTNQALMTDTTVDNALLDWLKKTRAPDPNKKQRNKKLNVPPGQSVSSDDFEIIAPQPRKEKKVKQNKKPKKDISTVPPTDSDSLFQPPFTPKYPASLKQLCITVINHHLIRHIETSEEFNVCCLTDTLRTDKINKPFIGELPECLKPTKTKIMVTSDITIQAKPSQSKQKKINLKKSETKITRSALHMKLVPMEQKVATEQIKGLTDITQEPKNNQKENQHMDERRKPKQEMATEQIKGLADMTQKLRNKQKENQYMDESRKRKIKRKGTNKAKKRKALKQRNRRSYRSETSSTCSESEKYTVDTDDSEYETMEDYIAACLQEEENVEPSIPFGISEIQYLKEDVKKLKTDSWVLAKFVTKKSVKHFVGKVMTIKDNIPEVKFVRKVKESKFITGLVFTYPRVDDICTMKHLDDILLILPEPNISRRGQIVFNNIDLSKYNLQ